MGKQKSKFRPVPKKGTALLIAALISAMPMHAHAYGESTWMGQVIQTLMDKAYQAAERKFEQVKTQGISSNFWSNPIEALMKDGKQYGKEQLEIIKQVGIDWGTCIATHAIKAMVFGKQEEAREICNEEAKQRLAGVDKTGVTPEEQSEAKKIQTVSGSGRSANNVFFKTVRDGASLLDPRGTETIEKEFVDSIHREVGRTADQLASEGAAGVEARNRLSQYLTMFPVVPVGNEIATDEKSGWFNNSDTQRSLLATALVGIRELSVSNQRTLNDGAYFLQAEKYKKYARMQFARMTILQSLDPETIKTMKQMFENYVLKPGVEQLGGYDLNGKYHKGQTLSKEQLAQLEIRQLQAINWNLLEMRRLAMEHNRIGGVLIAVGEDGGSQMGRGGSGNGGGGGEGRNAAKAAPTESFGLNQ